MYEYTRMVYYYETDKMGIVHHANYLLLLEEARTHYFNDNNLAYAETERLGVMSPVTDYTLIFKHPARYGDSYTVRLRIAQYTGVRFRVAYTVVNQDGEILLEGESGHAFVDANHKPVPLPRVIPERHELMKELVDE